MFLFIIDFELSIQIHLKLTVCRIYGDTRPIDELSNVLDFIIHFQQTAVSADIEGLDEWTKEAV